MIIANTSFIDYLNNNIGKRGIIHNEDANNKQLIESNYKLFYYYVNFIRYLSSVNADLMFDKLDFKVLI